MGKLKSSVVEMEGSNVCFVVNHNLDSVHYSGKVHDKTVKKFVDFATQENIEGEFVICTLTKVTQNEFEHCGDAIP